MKILTNQDNFESNSNIESNKFTIECSNKAFQILSKNIYSNPIKAIIRELCCNAIDAHRMAGNKDPIEVTVPTVQNNHFIVQDYGVGMSDEFVNKVYSSYFSSDKTSSNEVIGGLGLGSKTPFAYTDQFVVKTCKDGILNSYVVFKDENNIPNITRIKTEESDQSGTLIDVLIKPEDIKTFQKEAQKVFAFFDIMPIVNDDFYEIIPKLDYQELRDFIHNGQKTILPSDNSTLNHNMIRVTDRSSGFFVLMGEVLYNVNEPQESTIKNKWAYPSLYKTYDFFKIIKIDIGDVDIQPSREELNYSSSTLKFINDLFLSDFNTDEKIMKSFDNITEQAAWCYNIKRGHIFELMNYENILDNKFKFWMNFKGVLFYSKLVGRTNWLYRLVSYEAEYSYQNGVAAFFKNIFIYHTHTKAVIFEGKELDKLLHNSNTFHGIKAPSSFSRRLEQYNMGKGDELWMDIKAYDWFKSIGVILPVVYMNSLSKPKVSRNIKRSPEFLDSKGKDWTIQEIKDLKEEGYIVAYSVKHPTRDVYKIPKLKLLRDNPNINSKAALTTEDGSLYSQIRDFNILMQTIISDFDLMGSNRFKQFRCNFSTVKKHRLYKSNLMKTSYEVIVEAFIKNIKQLVKVIKDYKFEIPLSGKRTYLEELYTYGCNTYEGFEHVNLLKGDAKSTTKIQLINRLNEIFEFIKVRNFDDSINIKLGQIQEKLIQEIEKKPECDYDDLLRREFPMLKYVDFFYHHEREIVDYIAQCLNLKRKR